MPDLALLTDAIRAARQRIAPAIYHSPCPWSLALSRLCGCEIYCKLDHLQMTGSFKERGARNKLMLLDDEQRRGGVITASAGNHALGLAWHAHELNITAHVVMPRWAPLVKVKNCRASGATVILHGDTFDDARRHALDLAHQQNLTYIHGFDDLDIIAGQGTLGLEILEDVPDLDAVILPIGGGGLISGVGAAIKSQRPEVEIIGVEPRNAAGYHASLQAGRVVRIETRPTLADGLAVAEIGRHCFDIAREVVDKLLLVDEQQLATAVLRLLEMEKAVVEGAGAAPLAAMLSGRLTELAGKKVVLALVGGNIDVTLISRIIDRGLAADGRLCQIVAQVSDRPGGLARLTAAIAATGASIIDVLHDRHFGPADVAQVAVRVTLETRDADHIDEIRRALHDAGIAFVFDGSPAPAHFPDPAAAPASPSSSSPSSSSASAPASDNSSAGA